MKGHGRSLFFVGFFLGGGVLVSEVLSPDNAYTTKMKWSKAGLVIIIITPRREGEKRKQSRNVWKMQFSPQKPSALAAHNLRLLLIKIKPSSVSGSY